MYTGPNRKGYTSLRYLKMLGIEPKAAVEVGNAEMMKQLVRGGLGLAVTSRHIAGEELQDGILGEVLLQTPGYSRSMYVVRNRGYVTQSQKAFIDHLVSGAPNISPLGE